MQDAGDRMPTSHHAGPGLWLAFALAALASLAPLWVPDYVPATDLPQHAAQVHLWRSFDAGALGVVMRHEIHWLNPYLVGYGLARIFALVVSIPVALKLVFTLAVLALPVATLDLLRRQGADPWWSLAAFPLAFGVSFYWGFLNFLVGLPVAVVYLGRSHRLLKRPWLLFVATVALLPFHVLLFGWCLGIAVLAALGSRNERRGLALLALAATLPLLALWLRGMESSAGVLAHAVHWDWGWHRVFELVSYLLSAEGADARAVGVGLLALGGLALLAGSRRPSRHQVVVGIGLLAGASMLPREAFGLDWIAPRFAVFPAVWALGLLGSSRVSGTRRHAARAWVLAFAVVWPLSLLPGFQAFDREMKSFEELAALVRPGEKVLGVVPDATVEGVPGHPLGHATAWLALQGAEPVFQFSLLPQSLVQRIDRPLHPVPPGAWYEDPGGVLSSEWPDAVLLRRPARSDLDRLERDPGRWELSARRGDWWLFRRMPGTAGRAFPEEHPGVDGAAPEPESRGIVE
jgi:hypothetical protein